MKADEVHYTRAAPTLVVKLKVEGMGRSRGGRDAHPRQLPAVSLKSKAQLQVHTMCAPEPGGL